MGGEPPVVEVVHDPLTLPQHPEYGPDQRVRRKFCLSSVAIVDNHTCPRVWVVRLDHSLHCNS